MKVSLDNVQTQTVNVPSDYTLAVTTDGGGSDSQSVTGQVRDSAGNPLVLATVRLSLGGQTTATDLSDGSGNYTLSDSSDTYDLSALKTGYQTANAGTVDIDTASQSAAIINITMTPDGGTDTDGDGIPDASDPNPSNADTDGDGLCDGANTVAGICVAGEDLNNNGTVDSGETDPNLWDTDGDGFDDGVEATYNSDPLLDSDTPANGDVNEDGNVDAADVLLVTRFVTGQATPTPAEEMRADVAPFNGTYPLPDGNINAADLLRVQRMVLGL